MLNLLGYDPEVWKQFWKEFHDELYAWLEQEILNEKVPCVTGRVQDVWVYGFCASMTCRLMKKASGRYDIPEEILKWRIGADLSRVHDLRMVSIFALDSDGRKQDIASLAGIG